MKLYQKEIKSFWEDCANKTEHLLRQHWKEVDAIADALIKHGDLSGKEVTQIIRGLPESNGHHPEEAKQVVSDAIAEKVEPPSEHEAVWVHESAD